MAPVELYGNGGGLMFILKPGVTHRDHFDGKKVYVESESNGFVLYTSIVGRDKEEGSDFYPGNSVSLDSGILARAI